MTRHVGARENCNDNESEADERRDESSVIDRTQSVARESEDHGAQYADHCKKTGGLGEAGERPRGHPGPLTRASSGTGAKAEQRDHRKEQNKIKR